LKWLKSLEIIGFFQNYMLKSRSYKRQSYIAK